MLAVNPQRPVPPGALPDGVRLADLSYKEVLQLAKNRVVREYLQELMRDCEGNVRRAAERAAIERESMHRLLRRYDVRPDDYRSSV